MLEELFGSNGWKYFLSLVSNNKELVEKNCILNAADLLQLGRHRGQYDVYLWLLNWEKKIRLEELDYRESFAIEEQESSDEGELPTPEE